MTNSRTDRNAFSPPERTQLALASTSPRRSGLLTQLGVRFVTLQVETEERPETGESTDAYVRRVAGEKSRLGIDVCRGQLPVLAADTEVVIEGEVLGKPRDYLDARAMLSRLSDRCHSVVTAVSLRAGTSHWETMSESRVWFRAIADCEIRAYWDSGEPCDKAGGYAIQGRGGLFVRRIDGSYSGIVGLPLFETAELLARIGIDACSLLGADGGC